MAANAVFDDAVFDAAVFGGRADLFGSEYDPLVFDTDAAPSVLTVTLDLTDEDDALLATVTVAASAPAPSAQPMVAMGGGGGRRWEETEQYRLYHELLHSFHARLQLTDGDDFLMSTAVIGSLRLQRSDLQLIRSTTYPALIRSEGARLIRSTHA